MKITGGVPGNPRRLASRLSPHLAGTTADAHGSASSLPVPLQRALAARDFGALQAADIVTLQRMVGNHVVGRLLTASPTIQPVRLPVGGTIVETDYYDVNTLEQGMIYGVRGTATATKEEKPALERVISERRKRQQYHAPGAEEKSTEPKKADYDATMRRHEAGRERLRLLVDQGLRSKDPLLRNSCQWVKAGKAKLYAVTDLEDTADRLFATAGHDPKEYSQFKGYGFLYPDAHKVEKGDIYSDPEPYDWQASFDEAGLDQLCAKVAVEPVGTKGWYQSGKIAIAVGRLGSEEDLRTYFIQTLKHEVQHAADLHDEDEAPLGPKSDENLLQHAKIDFDTEYRAHSLMGHRDVLAASPEKIENFIYGKEFEVTQQHNAICRLVWKNIGFKYDPSDRNANHEAPLLDPKQLKTLFGYMATRDAVAAGVNLLNSVRIDNFYATLKKRAEIRIVSAYLELEPSEQQYLKEHPGAKEKVQILIGTGIGHWTDPEAFWRDLDRIDSVIKASFSLAHMYGWSRSYQIEQALTHELDYLLKP